MVILQLLDYLLGHGHVALFRRAELKTLVDLHGNEVCTEIFGAIKMYLIFILLVSCTCLAFCLLQFVPFAFSFNFLLGLFALFILCKLDIIAYFGLIMFHFFNPLVYYHE